MADLAWCHESQLREWLPWIDRHNLDVPADAASWRSQFRALMARRRTALGIAGSGTFEVFRVTAWGLVPSLDRILADFPGVSAEASRLDRLRRRLDDWRAAAGE